MNLGGQVIQRWFWGFLTHLLHRCRVYNIDNCTIVAYRHIGYNLFCVNSSAQLNFGSTRATLDQRCGQVTHSGCLYVFWFLMRYRFYRFKNWVISTCSIVRNKVRNLSFVARLLPSLPFNHFHFHLNAPCLQGRISFVARPVPLLT